MSKHTAFIIAKECMCRHSFLSKISHPPLSHFFYSLSWSCRRCFIRITDGKNRIQFTKSLFQTRSRYSVLSGRKKNDRYVLYAGSFKSLFAPCHPNLHFLSLHHFPDNLRRKSGLPQFSAQFFRHLSRHCKQQSA